MENNAASDKFWDLPISLSIICSKSLSILYSITIALINLLEQLSLFNYINYYVETLHVTSLT